MRAGIAVNHSPPSSAEVKNEWSYTSAPPVRLHGMDDAFTYLIVLPFDVIVYPTNTSK